MSNAMRIILLSLIASTVASVVFPESAVLLLAISQASTLGLFWLLLSDHLRKMRLIGEISEGLAKAGAALERRVQSLSQETQQLKQEIGQLKQGTGSTNSDSTQKS